MEFNYIATQVLGKQKHKTHNYLDKEKKVCVWGGRIPELFQVKVIHNMKMHGIFEILKIVCYGEA